MKKFNSNNESEFASTVTSEDFFPDIEKMTEKGEKNQPNPQEEENTQEEESSFDAEKEMLNDDSELIDDDDGASPNPDTPPQLQKINNGENGVIPVPVSSQTKEQSSLGPKTSINVVSESVAKPRERSRKTTPPKRVIGPTTTVVVKKPQKPHRFRSGTVALREIRKYQKSTESLIRKRPFQRLVREITESVPRSNSNGPMRFTSESINALQEAAESYMVRFFEDSYLYTLSSGRIMLTTKDMKFIKMVRSKDSKN